MKQLDNFVPRFQELGIFMAENAFVLFDNELPEFVKQAGAPAKKLIAPARDVGAMLEKYVAFMKDQLPKKPAGFWDPKASRERISVVHGIVHTSTAASNRQPFNSRMLSSIRAGASGSPVIDAGGSFLGVIHSGTREFDQQLPGKYSRFDVIAVFHNNNAVAEFLTKEGIDFFFRGQTRLLPKFEHVGLLYNVTALIECN